MSNRKGKLERQDSLPFPSTPSAKALLGARCRNLSTSNG